MLANSTAISMDQITSQPPQGLREEVFRDVIKLMNDGVESGVAPGMVLSVGKQGHHLFNQSFGVRYNKSPVETASNNLSIHTVYDVASLTSVVVTTTLVMKLVEQGKIKLTDRVVRFVQGFGVMGKSVITLGQLLSHTAGFNSWAPYFEELVRENAGARLGVLTSRGAKEYIFNSILRAPLKFEAGSRQVYSELGVILIGQIVELLTGLSIDKAAQRYVFQELGMRSSSYIDLSMIKRRGIHPVTDMIAPTEECPWRKRILCGEVHDDNAWVMGGIAGHSGLFTTAGDLHLFAREIIASYHNQSNFLKRETLQEFWKRPAVAPTDGWRFGWDTPSEENGMDDSELSPDSVGVCSFTGCSLWIEPETGVDIVLLSNRINPSRSNKRIISFRSAVHAAVLKAINSL